MKRLQIAGLIGMYLAAIVAANLIITRYGPEASIVTAFFFIGLDLCTRDALASWWGTTRWQKMALLILAGSALSYLVNRNAVTIAEASAIAFASSEVAEAVLYHLVRKRPWVERANIAAILGAAIDSVVFVTIAFGFSWQIVTAQSFAKLAGCFVWSLLIVWLLPSRRTVEVSA
jgi:uncharacterized PurR-regulated membrane protein YhhQ (DUF165 family)